MNRHNIIRTLIVLTLCGIALLNGTAYSVSPPKPCGAVPTDQQVKWLRMEWYAFVHFGINTYTGREWGYGDETPKQFNPSDFDAEIAVKAFKQAGMTGMIYTAKHHDGFCLWSTKSTKHNITRAPWRDGKGDVVAEFSKACKKYGIKFGTYLSPWDRNCAEYGRPGYLKVYEKQIRELLTNYGPIFEIWFDGAQGGDGYYGGAKESRNIGNADTYYNFPRIVKLIRSIQPNCIIWGAAAHGDARWGGSEKGDVNYPVWNVGKPGDKSSKWISLEGDTKINHAGWFWHENQAGKVKSPEQLMRTYFCSVGHGANLILNVAMNKNGKPDKVDLDALKGFGEMRRQLLAKDYAVHAKASASEVRGNAKEFAASNVTDGDIESYWCPEDGTTKDCWVEVQLDKPATFDVVRLREQIRLGQRVKNFHLEGYIDGKWKKLEEQQAVFNGGDAQWRPFTEQDAAKGKTIGNQVLRRLAAPVTTDRVRLVITDSLACPCISEISLLQYPHEITLSEAEGIKSSQQADKERFLPRTGWSSKTKGARKAWDNDENTYWQGKKQLTINLGEITEFSGFACLPKQNHEYKGLTDRYVFEVSMDGKEWEKVAEGEFPNVRADPILQEQTFEKKVKARFIRYIGTTALEGKGASAAELYLLK